MARRSWRMRYGALGALVWLAALCPGAARPAAPSLCARLANQLRGSPGIAAKDARQPGRWLRPWVAFAQAHPVKSEALAAQLVAQWRTAMGPAAPTRIERLPAAGLIRISRNGGQIDRYCSHAMFFKRQRGGVRHVLSLPPLYRTPCGYRHQSGSLATVLGRPAYVESEALDLSRSDALLQISPWRGSDWGRPCSVAIRFTHRSRVTRQLYCGAQRTVCAAARQIAPAVGRRYQLYAVNAVDAVTGHASGARVQFDDSRRVRAWLLIDHAQRIATAKSLAAVRGPSPAWLRHFRLGRVEYFPLRLNGTSYLGAIGPIAYGARTLFGVYQMPRGRSRRLVPLAVVRMRWQRDGVKSIQIRGARASPIAR